jgi:urea transport system ATP-binding protein
LYLLFRYISTVYLSLCYHFFQRVLKTLSLSPPKLWENLYQEIVSIPTTESHFATSKLMLQISKLNVYYGESHILRDVDLSVPPGQMVCLIGRNGVGKTTLLKTVMGLIKPRSGSVTFAEQPITTKTPDQRARMGIGYVPQGREIIPRLTVKENLLLGLEARADQPRRTTTIPNEIFALFPVLRSMLSRMGGDLSGGQQQQLAIARALMGNPQLLVLDEPTEGIQPSIILDIEAAVRRIVATTGISVLLVEQHLHFVRQADRYYAMQKGGVVASGSTSELSNEVIQRFLAV